jgi:hypothetical protein
MVHRPFHGYSTSALRELSRDLGSSQAQLEDQRADYVKRAGSDYDDLRELDALITSLSNQILAVDQEVVSRRRERAAIPPSGYRGVTQRPGQVRRHTPRVMQANPKPHCRARTLPAEVRRPR